jgi:hypothetical protein
MKCRTVLHGFQLSNTPFEKNEQMAETEMGCSTVQRIGVNLTRFKRIIADSKPTSGLPLSFSAKSVFNRFAKRFGRFIDIV